jgi:hypothetical protein
MADVDKDELWKAASELALGGYPVFPVRLVRRADGRTVKQPCTPHGHLDASSDPLDVMIMFGEQYPDATLIGVPTGERTGFDVLDADPDAAVWEVEHLAELGNGRRHHTMRGRHYLYQHAPGLRGFADKTGKHIAPGVDVRADGNFIVWWPALGNLVEGQGIPPWPPRLLELAMKARPVVTGTASGKLDPPPSVDAVVSLLDAMEHPAEFPRDDYVAVNLAAVGIIHSLSGDDADRADEIADAVVEWSAKWPGTDIETEQRKWNADYSTRIRDISGWNNLLTHARSLGVNTQPWITAGAVAQFVKVPLPDLEPAPVAAKPKLRLLTPEDCENAIGRKYIVKGMIAQGDVGCVFGAPGAGKSVVAPYIGYALAQGRDVFGRRTRAGGVFYVAAEDSHGMRQRTRGLRLTHGDAPDFRVAEGLSNLADPDEATELSRLVAKHRPALIFIDTMAMAFPGQDENTAEAMSRVVAAARRLTEHGAAVILIHHDTKAQDGTPRGHSLLNGALDFSMHLGKTDDSGIVRGKLVKNRNGPCDVAVAFRINSLVIGQDEDGDDITTPQLAVVTETSKPDKLPRAAKAALTILSEMIDANGGKPVVESDWRDLCADDRRVSTADERDSRMLAFRRAYDRLIDLKRVRQVDGLVSLAGSDSTVTDDLNDLVGSRE